MGCLLFFCVHTNYRATQSCGEGIYLWEQGLWEQGLPAMNENAVLLLNRGAGIAGKPCSHK
ncbi:hypothetical protein CFII68_13911 [Pseudomonas sp. CFII68]|nr:hypothetical protein CFII68_13911 [Pseudomonas sp. CFII68]